MPEQIISSTYDITCRRCPRLAAFLDEVRAAHPDYHCRPVPPFGDPDARLVIVGLAPGMHGANASGRPFTGDYAGILLYETLHEICGEIRKTPFKRPRSWNRNWRLPIAD